MADDDHCFLLAESLKSVFIYRSQNLLLLKKQVLKKLVVTKLPINKLIEFKLDLFLLM